MSVPTIQIDVLIFGGGIAGLWTLARLRREGYSCVLLENKALGSGQTIASQGIIHGGIKYALTGKASAASTAISQMPDIWRACLRGEGAVDLRAVSVLSERQYLWTTGGIGSRLMGVAASKVIRTAVQAVPTAQRPDWLKAAPRTVDAYTVEEPILDPRSLIGSLASTIAAPMLHAESEAAHLDWVHARGGIGVRLSAGAGTHRMVVLPQRWVLTAGEGNAELQERLGLNEGNLGAPIGRQLRPLHMVMARGPLPEVFGHCVGMSDKPRITITSQHDGAGRRMVWYIGGQIAESGVGLTSPSQIDAARAEVRACLPWVDISACQWSSFLINRAEGADPSGRAQRPDEPVVSAAANVLVAYPTKLAFAPLLAERIAQTLTSQGISPSSSDNTTSMRDWPRPPIAPLPWDREDLTWT